MLAGDCAIEFFAGSERAYCWNDCVRRRGRRVLSNEALRPLLVGGGRSTGGLKRTPRTHESTKPGSNSSSDGRHPGFADERYSSDRVFPQRPRGTCGRRATCNLRTDEMRGRQVTTGGFSSKRLARVRELLERHVDSGFVPGVVAVLARHGEVQVEATGNLAFEGAGSRTPMAGDTICRMGSMSDDARRGLHPPPR